MLKHPSFTKLLMEMEPVLSAFGIDYYLVGAVARDIQLGPGAESTRKTQDIDIAVLINDEDRFYELKEALIASGKFEGHPHEAIKLYYKKAIEVKPFSINPLTPINGRAALKQKPGNINYLLP